MTPIVVLYIADILAIFGAIVFAVLWLKGKFFPSVWITYNLEEDEELAISGYRTNRTVTLWLGLATLILAGITVSYWLIGY